MSAPSVCLSVKRDCEQKLVHAHILIPYERSMFLLLRHKQWMVGDVPST